MARNPSVNPAVESLEQRVMMSATDLASCATPLPMLEHGPGCGCGACQTITDDAGELTVMAPIDDGQWLTLVDSCGIVELDDADHFDANGFEFHDTPGADGTLASTELTEAALRAQIDAWLKEAGVAVGEGGEVAAATTASGVPILHSNPTATVKLYLDFDGHYEASWGSYGATSTPAYDIDGNAGSFSATEVSRMTEIWARVAEDYAPFNIDVTTEEPPSFANGAALRVVIGGSSYDWYGKGAGGVSYINSFTNSVANVAYVFEDQLGNGTVKYVAEAASHEAGHAFGLRHQAVWDGNTKIADYDQGSNGWAPIMGVGYYQSWTTWQYGKNSNGDMQDDLAVLAGSTNDFGYRADDHGGSNGSATVLAVNGTSGAFSGSGIIERNGDADVFGVHVGAGTLNVAVSVAQYGANLDSTLGLYNAQGQLVASASPSTSQGASLSVNVSAGDYFIRVSGGSTYGSLGQYTVTGTATPDNGGQAIGPEVAVTFNGNNIADGSTNAIDFGTLTKGQAGGTLTFTVRNDGDQTLNLSGLTAPSGFTITSGLPSSLAAGASATFAVRLDTTTAGAKGGQITFTSNDADESLFNFAVTGNVMNGPELTVLLGGANIADGSTTPIDFGTVTKGQNGSSLTFTVRNDGDQTLNLSGLAAPSGFTITSGLPSSLAAGASATFTLRLDASAVGTKSGQITFASNDADESLFNFAITGNVAAGPEVTVLMGGTNIADGSTNAIDFGTLTKGQSGSSLTFTVRNDGDQTLNLSGLTAPSGFTITSGLPSSLAAGTSATFIVRLDASTVGTKSGQLGFATNDADESTFTFAVIGTVAEPNFMGPEITVLRGNTVLVDGQNGAIDFGTVRRDEAGPTIAFTVRNDGDQTLDLTTLSVPNGYVVVGSLAGTLAAGATTTFTIRLDSATVGTHDGRIMITSNDADEPVFDFAVTGRVMNGPEVTVLLNGTNIADGATNPIDFGSVTRGDVGGSLTFTVRNDGDQSLDLSGLTAPSGFTITGNLPASIAAGASASFTVRLDTTTAGTMSGQITFATNDYDEGVFNFAVTGLVTEPQFAGPDVTVMLNGNNIADGSMSPIDFGSVTTGQSGRSLTFTVRNDGDQTLNLSGLSAPAGYTITSGLPSSLAAGDSAAFTIRLDATIAGTKVGAISFTTNDGDEPLFDFAVIGTVMIGPDIAVSRGNTNLASGSTAAVDFGTVIEGDAGPTITFTVRNAGDQTLTFTGLTTPTGFTVTSGLPASLAAGATATFTIRLDSGLVGVKSGVIAIASNDSDTPTFTFAVAGEIQQQQNATRENRLDFDANQGGWFYDSDGDKVSIDISGRGSGRIVLDENGDAAGVEFTGTDSHTNVTITTDGSGDNRAVFGFMSIDGSLRRLQGPTTWLTGAFTITGSIKFANLASFGSTDGGGSTDTGGDSGAGKSNGKGNGNSKNLAAVITTTPEGDSTVDADTKVGHGRADRFRINFASENAGRYRAL